LYDNELDPYQLNNLVNQADYAQVQSDLERQLTAKLVAIKDEFHSGDWYIAKWGYTVDASGGVPYGA
jgi:hypothetical protein